MTLSLALYIALILNAVITAVLVCRADKRLTLFTLLSCLTCGALVHFCALYPMELTPEILTYGGGE